MYTYNWIFHFALFFLNVVFFPGRVSKKKNESDLGSEDP